MAKESLYAPIKSAVFRETFADEQTTRALGGVPTSVTYSGGVGAFNGSSSYILYSSKAFGITPVFTVRIRLTSYTLASGSVTNFCDFRNSDGTGSGYIVDNTGGSLGVNSGTSYINGVASSTLTTSTKEIVVTGMTLGGVTSLTRQIYIGSRYSVSNFMNGSIELFEIYEGTLTANEVANLYNNKRYKTLDYSSDIQEIINLNATSGGIVNKYGSFTNTNTTIIRDGNIYALNFATNPSNINLGSNTLLDNYTLILWVKNEFQTTGALNLFSNGQFILQADYGGGATYYFSRSNFTGTYRFGGTIKRNTWQMVVVTTTPTSCEIFINGISVVSGSITTAVSGTSITVGNGSVSGKTRISNCRLLTGILTAQEISALFSSERKNYNV